MTTAPQAGSAPRLDRDGEVFVLNLGDGENRFHPDWVGAVDAALAEVEAAEGQRALVTTATGKFFSNGLDLDWLGAHAEQHDAYIADAERLFARLLALPVITVVAIQGHAFAAGAMLTLSHDFRVMRADRGFWCLPEIDIDMPFTHGMNALITARLTPQTAHEAMLTGRRYGGADAHGAGIVDHAVPELEVLPAAIELARANTSKAGTTLATIKTRLYEDALSELATPR
ncbi:enoyl-CoA hydratase-related protein [Nocardioides sp. Iso805N]|uniref:enoyl-CoA hydratase-related protein n=1 Tax=Nocardioides sp. Iso805N TaxID=1283287 RepID=UPI0003701559|nr:enoyl-CoA hydratase-related protein [Nocardioides sp. Iso805N]